MTQHEGRIGVQILSRKECIDLLGEVPVGRVAVAIGALPAIFPVNFQVWGEDLILFCAMKGSRLARSTDNAVIAFQADSYDHEQHTGWTVSSVGLSTCVPSRDDSGLRGVAPDPWVTGHDPELLIQLRLGEITGHRIL
jgi:hypothetical protein